MEKGKLVRVIANPGRIGFTTGRIIQRAGKDLYQIQFPDLAQYFPIDQIEVILEVSNHPLDMLREGKLGRAGDLRQLLTHIKLSGKLMDLLYSMEISNTDFYAYQFKPVIKILNSLGKGVLIADEVGLGKTIEASLIWTELKSRYEYRRLMILCPAFLRDKWQMELKHRFGIKAEILDAKDVLKKLKTISDGNRDNDFAIIASLQGLRPMRNWEEEKPKERIVNTLARFLQDNQTQEPLIDLLVIDEAHYLRVADPKKATKKTTILGRLLSEISEHLVLLSATPIHLRGQDLYQLLNLIDDATFNNSDVFGEILKANAPLVKLRDLILNKKISQEEFIEHIDEALSFNLLKNSRQLNSMRDNPPSKDDLELENSRSELAYKLETVNLLGHVVTRTRKRDVTEWRVIREVIPVVIEPNAQEYEFYRNITDLVRDFCQQHDKQLGFILVTPQRQMSSSIPAALKEWLKNIKPDSQQIYEDTGIDVEGQESKPGDAFKKLISKLSTIGKYSDYKKYDSKYNEFRELIKNILSKNPKEKFIVFSFFRATILYLKERLLEDGINAIEVMGGKDYDKDEIIEKFQMSDDINVLISSEVGSEGIDLQFSRYLINYDLPWNPMKIEQRIGRIDRIGQKFPKIIIFNLFFNNTIDGRIYNALFKRLEIFEYALGNLEPILGEEIQKLTLDLLTGKMTPEQEIQRIEQTKVALENKKKEEDNLENDASNLVAYGDYILNKVKAIRELNRWVNGKDIQIYVFDFTKLRYPGCEFVQIEKDKLIYEIKLTTNLQHDLDDFIKTEKLSVNTILTRINSTPVRCIFENKLVTERKYHSETINQFHPLVRFINHKLKTDEFKYKPAVSVKLQIEKLNFDLDKGIYVFTVHLWRIKGLQDMEKVFYSAVPYDNSEKLIKDDQAEILITTAANFGEDWLEGRNSVDIERVFDLSNDICSVYSDNQFEKYSNDLKNKNEDRADLQLNTLEIHIKNQIKKHMITRDNLVAKGKLSYAKGWETRIKLLEQKFERKKIEILQRKNILPERIEISAGILKIY